MSDFTPLSSITSTLRPEPGGIGPIGTKKPATLESFNRKWTPAQEILTRQGIPRSVWAPIMEIDLQRASSGQNVLSANETLLALRAAQTHQAQYQRPKGGLLTRATRDIRQIVSAVPRLPLMLAEEVTQLPKAPGQVLSGISHGDIGEVARAPGVRMLPGAFTIENIAEGRSPLDHPVMTLLDLLPYASKAAGTLPKVADARAALIEQGYAGRASPLRTAAREYVGKPYANRVETKTGRPYRGMLTKFGVSSTKQGELAKQAAVAGRYGDDIMREINEELTGIRKRRGIADDRMPLIHEAASTGRRGELTPNENAYIDEVEAFQQKVLTREGLAANELNAREGLVEMGGEYYEARNANVRKIIKARQQEAAKAKALTTLGEKVGKIQNDIFWRQEILERQGWLRYAGEQNLDEPFVYFEAPHSRVSSPSAGEIEARWIDEGNMPWDAPKSRSEYTVQQEEIAKVHDDILRETVQDTLGGDILREIHSAGEIQKISLKSAMASPEGLKQWADNQIYRKTKAPAKSIARAIEKGRFGEASKWADGVAKKMRDLYVETHNPAIGELAAIWKKRADDLLASAEFLNIRKVIRQKSKDLPKYQARLEELAEQQAEAAARAAELEAKTNPARYEPLIREQTLRNLKEMVKGDEKIREKIVAAGGLPDEIDWAEVTIRMEENLPLDIPGLSEANYRLAAREARATWMELKALAEYPPVFAHAVDLGQAATIEHPIRAFVRQERTPTSEKARTLDPKPMVKNLEIAMLHQSRELLQRVVDRKVRDWVTDESGWVRQGEDLFFQYEEAARRTLARHGDRLPAGTTVGQLADELLNEDFVLWDPKALVPTSKGHLTRTNLRKGMYVPRWLDKAMTDMYPTSKSALGGVLDRVHRVFRLSILPLSPRWHINNIIGGGVMLGAEAGPAVFRHWKAARQLLKNGELPFEISMGAGSVPAADAAWGLATGRELGRLWQNEQLQKALQDPARKAAGTFKRATDTSFAMGEYVDKFYRSMAYLEGKSKGERMGLSPPAARRQGIELADKVLQDWDRMTPVERSIIRQVFPFYGWMKHILRYTLSMPLDHPTRTAIMTNFAANEWEDWGTGIPERFFQMFVLGKPDENGTIQAKLGLNPLEWSGAINMKGTNPFSDVANYMTLAGFVGQLSPVGSGFLEAMGINPATGTANLYPETVYNEVLGRNIAKGPNAGLSILRNVVPQFDFVMDAIGMTPADLRNLKLQDPDLYNQRVLSSIGMPFIPRDLNVQREAALAEIARNKDAVGALNAALRSGDWSKAMQYPEIRPLLEAIKAMPRSQLEPLLIGQRPKLAG